MKKSIVALILFTSIGFSSSVAHEVFAPYLSEVQIRDVPGTYDPVDKSLNLSGIKFRIARYKEDKSCAISYTFDDGLREHYTLVRPHLKKLGFKATFWINGSKINLNENAITDTTRMTWKNLREMGSSGHEISNHGWAHKNFGRHTLDEIKKDIYKNDSAIFAHIGIMPRTFCYPNNKKTPEGFKVASENRVGTRTVQYSVGGKSTNENLEKWVNTLLDTNGWGVTMTHGITYGYDHFQSEDILWNHLKEVKSQEDKIWIGTFREVATYVKARDSVTYQVTQENNKLRVIPHLTLNRELFAGRLTAVVEQMGIQKIKIRQGKRKLKAAVHDNAAVFEFDPFGGPIDIEIRL